MVKIKRAYEPVSRSDGMRVLVDGLWPRGVKKESLELASWARELAPSAGLRKWFGHDPARWEEFRQRYRRELDAPERVRVLDELATHAARRTVTLVFGARDEERNNAVVLAEEITRRVREHARSGAHA